MLGCTIHSNNTPKLSHTFYIYKSLNNRAPYLSDTKMLTIVLIFAFGSIGASASALSDMKCEGQCLSDGTCCPSDGKFYVSYIRVISTYSKIL